MMIKAYIDSSIDRPRKLPLRSSRSGFTLIELLVVVGLLLLLAAITASAINLTINNDKARAGARQVQSYLAGARDRAIYANSPRGVRFLLDPTNNRTVSSMIYIQQTDPWSQGTIELERLDVNVENDGVADQYNATTMPNPPAVIVRGFDNDPSNPYAVPTNWHDLYNQGLLYNGARIKIPSDSTGTWYTVTTELLHNASQPGFVGAYYPPRLHLTTSYAISPTNTLNGAAVPAFITGGPQTYLLELPPSVLPNADPVLMPKGAVVHLDRCTSTGNLEQASAGSPPSRADKLPSAWKQYPSVTQAFTGAVDPTGFDYTTQMDVLFSPRGVVIGPAAQRGIIHLYIGLQKDADRDRLVYWNTGTYPTASAPEYGTLTGDTYERGDKVVLSLFTRTGAVSTHSISSNADPFQFAETGEVAGK